MIVGMIAEAIGLAGGCWLFSRQLRQMPNRRVSLFQRRGWGRSGLDFVLGLVAFALIYFGARVPAQRHLWLPLTLLVPFVLAGAMLTHVHNRGIDRQDQPVR